MNKQHFPKINLNFYLVFCLTSLVILVLLNHRPLNNPDESRYSEIALEMLHSGDFITPRFNGVLFLDKPPLYYWLQASAIKLFGLSNGSLRFFPALFALLGSACVYHCCHQLINKKTAVLACAILLSSPLYFFIGLYANLDMEVAVLISCALLLFANAELGSLAPKQKTRYYYSAYLCGGLAFLTKGLIGIVLPGLSIGLWLVLSKQWHRLKHMRLPSGLLLVFLINAPWYYLAEKATPGFLHFFFYEQQFSRFVGHQFNAHNPFYFYPLLILAGTFPWSVFSGQTLYIHCKKLINKSTPHAQFLLYNLCWFIAITVFFSIPASKLASYIIPALPPLAILIAHYLANEGLSNPIIKYADYLLITISSIIVTMLVIGYFLLPMPTDGFLLVLIASISLLASSCTIFFSANRYNYYLAYFIGSLSACLFIIAAVPTWIEFLADKKPTIASTKTIAQVIQSQSSPYPLYAYKSFYYDLPIMLNHPINVVENWQEKDLEKNDSWLGKFAWGQQKEGKANPYLTLPSQFWPIWHSKQAILVITRIENLKDFKQYSVLHTHKRNALITNLTRRLTYEK